MSSGNKASKIIEENNQNKQGGRKFKTVDYCLQYGISKVKWGGGHGLMTPLFPQYFRLIVRELQGILQYKTMTKL